MSTRLSRRATTATFGGLAVAVVLVLSAFVWPGFLLSSNTCATPGTPTELTNGRTYCYRTVPVPEAATFNSSNPREGWAIYSQWGYTFGLFRPYSIGVGKLEVNITEPYLGTFSQVLAFGYGHPSNEIIPWFTPDNSSGVIIYDLVTPVQAFNVSLLVRA